MEEIIIIIIINHKWKKNCNKKWRKFFWGKEWKQLNYILDQIGHTHSQLACKKHSHIMFKAPKWGTGSSCRKQAESCIILLQTKKVKSATEVVWISLSLSLSLSSSSSQCSPTLLGTLKKILYNDRGRCQELNSHLHFWQCVTNYVF
jgi:hypothetical protein